MRKIFCFLLVASFFAACKNEPKPEENQGAPSLPSVSPAGELWGEHVRSQADIIKPEAWDTSEWKQVNKFIASGKIVTTLMDAVLSGKQKAYDPFDENRELSSQELKDMTGKSDTIMVDDPDHQGNLLSKVVERDFNKEITNIRFIEDWYFDPATFHLTKRVNAVVLAQAAYGDDGSFQGLKPMILIKLNN